MVERAGLPFPILADEQGVVLDRLGLVHEGGGPDGGDIALPAQVLIDSDGQLLWIYVAERIQNRLSPDQALDEARRALRQRNGVPG